MGWHLHIQEAKAALPSPWWHREMGQGHGQPQTPLAPWPQGEIQSLSLSTASSEIYDMGLEKSQAKQGLSCAKSFFWLPEDGV